MRRIRWEKGYEGFAWGCLIAAAALIAGAAIAGCHLHFHAFEKHYHEQGTKGLRDEGTEGTDPWIEANPRGEPGIEIVIPEPRTPAFTLGGVPPA
jgi:hypothetical protein